MDDIRCLEDEVKKELDRKLGNMGMRTEDKSLGSVKSTPY